MNHTIEILVTSGCIHWPITVDRVREAVSDLGLGESVEVRVSLVDDNEAATQVAFLGSPSVRVDGRDVEIGANDRNAIGLQCRLYRVDGRFEAAPPLRWIRNALVGADR